jgi:hypothetical protein
MQVIAVFRAISVTGCPGDNFHHAESGFPARPHPMLTTGMQATASFMAYASAIVLGSLLIFGFINTRLYYNLSAFALFSEIYKRNFP